MVYKYNLNEDADVDVALHVHKQFLNIYGGYDSAVSYAKLQMSLKDILQDGFNSSDPHTRQVTKRIANAFRDIGVLYQQIAGDVE